MMNCELFLGELEALETNAPKVSTAEGLLLRLTDAAREHATGCGECRAALEDFAETQRALARMEESLAEPGPWFTRRVMNAIAAQEAELEEKLNGFWIGVRRLAPRLVALAGLLLVLGGTWAFQVQRSTRQHGTQGTDGIFESVPNTPANDDVIASVNEVAKP
ncbi:MAG TPA: hypothetical protein VMH89_08255 [Candidatus Acidoferrum sp.]|nr:hypothetical protein [Candidatus Acidoferrum sp.]